MRKTLALLAGLSAIAAVHSAGAETLKVAVAQRGFWNSTFIDVGLKQGYFKEAGLDIEILYTEGGASTLTQVMSGQIDVGWSVPPFVLQQLADGKLVIIARGSDVAALAQQTIRVNVANVNALKEKRDALVRFVKVLKRSIDWAYSDPHAIDNYAEIAKVPRALAQQTRDEFFPKQALQLSEVKGLDVTLKQALEFKYITAPMSLTEAQGMLDILYKPDHK
ncbi:MAG TPA: ABC transporter substrate-binding protein [Xanthobacteraceae bacterium]|nr:ABC transporter substrate-binding protein [Xanthobacteraceae bacterium]